MATHNAATRANRLARENHQRFSEGSLRNSVHAHRGSANAQRRFHEDARRERNGSGFIGTLVGFLIIGVVAYAAYTFVASSGWSL